MSIILDPYSAIEFKKHVQKKMDAVKDHICYSVDTVEKLQYARGQLSAYEALLQDVKDGLQTEDKNGTIDQTENA